MPELTPEMQAVIDAARAYFKSYGDIFEGETQEIRAKLCNTVRALDRPKSIGDQVYAEFCKAMETRQGPPSVGDSIAHWAAQRGAALAIERAVELLKKNGGQLLGIISDIRAIAAPVEVKP